MTEKLFTGTLNHNKNKKPVMFSLYPCRNPIHCLSMSHLSQCPIPHITLSRPIHVQFIFCPIHNPATFHPLCCHEQSILQSCSIRVPVMPSPYPCHDPSIILSVYHAYSVISWYISSILLSCIIHTPVMSYPYPCHVPSITLSCPIPIAVPVMSHP